MAAKIGPLIGSLLIIVAASGVAITTLAVIDGTVTGDWVDATSAVGYPALGFVLLAQAGIGVLVVLAALAIFIAMLSRGSQGASRS